MNIYLNHSEEERVREVADDFGVTMAYVTRVALRRMLHLPIDEFAENLYRSVFCVDEVDMSKI